MTCKIWPHLPAKLRPPNQLCFPLSAATEVSFADSQEQKEISVRSVQPSIPETSIATWHYNKTISPHRPTAATSHAFLMTVTGSHSTSEPRSARGVLASGLRASSGTEALLLLCHG